MASQTAQSRQAPLSAMAAGGKYLVDTNPDAPVDSIPAMIDGQTPALLNSGEYVLTAEDVAALGGPKGIQAILNLALGKGREQAEEASEAPPGGLADMPAAAPAPDPMAYAQGGAVRLAMGGPATGANYDVQNQGIADDTSKRLGTFPGSDQTTMLNAQEAPLQNQKLVGAYSGPYFDNPLPGRWESAVPKIPEVSAIGGAPAFVKQTHEDLNSGDPDRYTKAKSYLDLMRPDPSTQTTVSPTTQTPQTTSTGVALPGGVSAFDKAGISSIANTSPDEPAGLAKVGAPGMAGSTNGPTPPAVSMQERLATQAEMQAGSAPTIRQFGTPNGTMETGFGAPKKEIKLGEWNTPSSTPDWIAKANEHARNNPLTAEQVSSALSVKDPSPEQLQEARGRAAEMGQMADAYRAGQQAKQDRVRAFESLRRTPDDTRETELRNAMVGYSFAKPSEHFAMREKAKGLRAMYGAQDANYAKMAGDIYSGDQTRAAGLDRLASAQELANSRIESAMQLANARRDGDLAKAAQGEWHTYDREVPPPPGSLSTANTKEVAGLINRKTGEMRGLPGAQGLPMPTGADKKYPQIASYWKQIRPEAQAALAAKIAQGVPESELLKGI